LFGDKLIIPMGKSQYSLCSTWITARLQRMFAQRLVWDKGWHYRLHKTLTPRTPFHSSSVHAVITNCWCPSGAPHHISWVGKYTKYERIDTSLHLALARMVKTCPKKVNQEKYIFLYIKQGSITHSFNVKKFYTLHSL